MSDGIQLIGHDLFCVLKRKHHHHKLRLIVHNSPAMGTGGAKKADDIRSRKIKTPATSRDNCRPLRGSGTTSLILTKTINRRFVGCQSPGPGYLPVNLTETWRPSVKASPDVKTCPEHINYDPE